MLVGGILSVLLGLVIIGGIKRIAAVTSKLVPGMALIYFIGALSVIVFNYENIIPSLVSIFADLFTGSAATGGFLGASISFAFNKGVGRGLFSNEAGQGSAPIAHAAAKANQPMSEGLVAILEPFIDTIVICSITALVLLSSGVWQEKLPNEFDYIDMQVLKGVYSDETEWGRMKLANHINGSEMQELFDGTLTVKEGRIQNDVSVLHARSLAEDVLVQLNGLPLDGTVSIVEGKPEDLNIIFSGNSLVHSAPLTAEAFTRSYFGWYGQYIVSIGLLLFAFSTAISWSYYGGRAMTFLMGTKSVKYYRIVYVLAFFIASFADTTIIWTLSGITIALMTLPNLFGILMLRKDMKQTVADYWSNFKKNWPHESTPE
jgi:AGCS family alanine or glycine:cation symporter